MKPSEFERKGPNKIGVFGLANAFEKLRVIYRTGTEDDLTEEPDEQVKGQDRNGN